MHFAMSTGCKLKLNGFRIGDDVTFILKYALSVTFVLNRNRLIEKNSLLLSEFQYYKCCIVSDDNLLRHFHYRRPSCLKRLFVSLYQPFTLSDAMNKILHTNNCEHGVRVVFTILKEDTGLFVWVRILASAICFYLLHTFFILILCQFSL